MNIAVIRASAGIGAETVKKALDIGHSVRAILRNNSAIPNYKSLTKIEGITLPVKHKPLS
jgi:putative NADH-flavin reductase